MDTYIYIWFELKLTSNTTLHKVEISDSQRFLVSENFHVLNGTLRSFLLPQIFSKYSNVCKFMPFVL